MYKIDVSMFTVREGAVLLRKVPIDVDKVVVEGTEANG